MIPRKRYNVLLTTLAALAAIGPFSTDMYLPGFSAIARSLNTDIAHVGFTLTSYFIGISFGQMLYGPLLDRFGRKKPVLLGLVLYIAAALGCAFAPSIPCLVALRFFLALGGCVGMVASRAVVRDLFSGSDIAHALSTLMMIFGIAPIIAPTIGGIVVTTLGWRFIFVVLAAIAFAVLIAISRLLHETKEGDVSVSLHPLHIVREYLTVLRERDFVVYAGAIATATGGLFSYIAGSPFVFIDLFHFSPSQFGWIYGFNACSLIVANQANRLLLRRYDSARVLIAASAAQCAVGLMLFTGAFARLLPETATLGLVVCFLFCFGVIMPNATALALHPFSRNAGSASGLIGGLQMIVGALSTASVSYLHNGTAVPMALVMAVSAAAGLVLLLPLRVVPATTG